VFDIVFYSFVIFYGMCCLCHQLGPNVTVGKNVVIHAGVRVRESIILDGAVVQV